MRLRSLPRQILPLPPSRPPAQQHPLPTRHKRAIMRSIRLHLQRRPASQPLLQHLQHQHPMSLTLGRHRLPRRPRVPTKRRKHLLQPRRREKSHACTRQRRMDHLRQPPGLTRRHQRRFHLQSHPRRPRSHKPVSDCQWRLRYDPDYQRHAACHPEYDVGWQDRLSD